MGISAAGYSIWRGPFSDTALATVRQAIADAVTRADPDEVRVGSTTVRVNGLLAKVPELAALLDHAPLLGAAKEIIGGPFRLSSLHARSLKPAADAQALHQDVQAGDEVWPLAGFILMLDRFTIGNGATRFVPNSANLTTFAQPLDEGSSGMTSACGDPGAIIVFDGSTWHGHGANMTGAWRHSVQGAFIPRAARPSVDFARILPIDALRRLSPAAHELL